MKCLNKNNVEIKRMIDSFGEVMTSQLLDFFPEGKLPSFEEVEVAFNSSNKVAYSLKSFDILSSDKGIQVFDKGVKAKWGIDRILTELQIPKEQKGIILALGTTDREQILLELANKYSYTVEINTANKIKPRNYGNNVTEEQVYNAINAITDKNDVLYNNSAEVEADGSDEYPNEIAFRANRYGLALDKFVDYGIENNSTLDEILNDIRQHFHNEDNEWWVFNREGIGDNYENHSDYSDLTVPGGTNYTVNAHVIPALKGKVLPDIYLNHDKEFANGDLNMYGWDRSDEQLQLSESDIKYKKEREEYYKAKGISPLEQELGNTNSKTRRILEIQSKFQKWRLNFEHKSNKYQILENQPTDKPNVFEDHYLENSKKITSKEYNKIFEEFLDTPTSQEDAFIKLIAKQWETMMIKSIIQESAKKGYEKVLFPTGNTASKVEGHTTLEEFKKQKEDRIKQIEKDLQLDKDSKVQEYSNYEGTDVGFVINKEFSKRYKKFVTEEEANNYKDTLIKAQESEIAQLKQELERIETEGFGALKPIWDFYENIVTNILINDIYGKESEFVNYEFTFNNAKYERLNDKNKFLKNGVEITQKEFNTIQNSVTKQDKKDGKFTDKYYVNSNAFITDEYGNTWNEIDLSKPLTKILLSETNKSDIATDDTLKQRVFKGKEVLTIEEALTNLESGKLGKLATFLKTKLTESSKKIPVEYINTDIIYTNSGIEARGLYGRERNLKPEEFIQIAGKAGFRKGNADSVILHEIIHALTANQLELNTETNKAFEVLYNKAKESMTGYWYALKNTDEFMVALFTNAKFIEALQQIPSEKTKYKNLYEEIMDFLLKLLGIDKRTNLYTEAFAVATNIIEDYYQNKQLQVTNDNIDNLPQDFFLDESEEFKSFSLLKRKTDEYYPTEKEWSRIENYSNKNKWDKRTKFNIGLKKPFWINDHLSVIRNRTKNGKLLSTFTAINSTTGEVISDKFVLKQTEEKVKQGKINSTPSIGRSANAALQTLRRRIIKSFNKEGINVFKDIKETVDYTSTIDNYMVELETINRLNSYLFDSTLETLSEKEKADIKEIFIQQFSNPLNIYKDSNEYRYLQSLPLLLLARLRFYKGRNINNSGGHFTFKTLQGMSETEWFDGDGQLKTLGEISHLDMSDVEQLEYYKVQYGLKKLKETKAFNYIDVDSIISEANKILKTGVVYFPTTISEIEDKEEGIEGKEVKSYNVRTLNKAVTNSLFIYLMNRYEVKIKEDFFNENDFELRSTRETLSEYGAYNGTGRNAFKGQFVGETSAEFLIEEYDKFLKVFEDAVYTANEEIAAEYEKRINNDPDLSYLHTLCLKLESLRSENIKENIHFFNVFASKYDILVHELGHSVDFLSRGAEANTILRGIIKALFENKTIAHLKESIYRHEMGDSYTKDTALSELFAEIFQAIQMPQFNDEGSISYTYLKEKLKGVTLEYKEKKFKITTREIKSLKEVKEIITIDDVTINEPLDFSISLFDYIVNLIKKINEVIKSLVSSSVKGVVTKRKQVEVIKLVENIELVNEIEEIVEINKMEAIEVISRLIDDILETSSFDNYYGKEEVEFLNNKSEESQSTEIEVKETVNPGFTEDMINFAKSKVEDQIEKCN